MPGVTDDHPQPPPTGQVVPHRPTSMDPQELGFTPQRPVGWLAPLLLLVPAIIPQLPGLTTFRALLAITSGEPAEGFSLLLSALTIGLALAAGVIFGGLVAQPVRREVDRLERRVGPRLIGPRHRR